MIAPGGSATVATLEAIKLFLSVPGMVFVIAADQEMVRDAIAMNLGDSKAADRFAQRYLDKIVQLPISLPDLPAHEAEALPRSPVGEAVAHGRAALAQVCASVGHALDPGSDAHRTLA